MFVSVSRGYGRHTADLTLEQATSAIEAEVIGEVLACASYPTGKASVAYLILRIFPGKKLRWFLGTLVAGNALFFCISVILIPAQCQPVAFQWDRSIPGGSCWDPAVVTDWGFLTGGSSRARMDDDCESKADMFDSVWCTDGLCTCYTALVLYPQAPDGPQGEDQHRHRAEHGHLCRHLLHPQELLQHNIVSPFRLYM